MTTSADSPAMLPYVEQGNIDYASLEYNPDEPEPIPDAMELEFVVQEILGIMHSRFTDFGNRPDVFLSSNTILCYDPANLNLRRQPDIYLAFGVDQAAIRRRKLYLTWEAGKPPGLALEVGSESAGSEDTVVKRRVYATVGIREYWRFDPSGGEHHDEPMSGWILRDGVYQRVELTGDTDGILKGYSRLMQLYLCWDEGWPRFYDPVTGTYLENWRQERAKYEAQRAAHEAELAAHEAEGVRLLAENARLMARVRRLESES